MTAILIGKYLFETYIQYRQYQVLKETQVPKELRLEISQETYDKSQEYSRAKARFNFANELYSLTKDLIYVNSNAFVALWNISGHVSAFFGSKMLSRFFGGVMSQSLLFFGISSLISVVELIPSQYYYNFVLEEKFGFNKQTKSLFFIDLIKSLVLSIVLGTPFIYGLLRIVNAYGRSFVLYACGLVLVFILAIQTLAPTFILPLFNKFSPLEEGELKTEIEKLATDHKFPLHSLTTMDGSKRSSHLNAMFIGLPWSKKIALFDTLVEKLSTAEIVAVLGHEIGHWRLGHTLQMTGLMLVTTGSVFGAYLLFMFNESLVRLFGFQRLETMVALHLFFYLYTPMSCLTSFLTNAFTRKNEFEADDFAKDCGHGHELSTGLIKMSKDELLVFRCDPLYSAYHFTHPPLTERLANLSYFSKEKVT